MKKTYAQVAAEVDALKGTDAELEGLVPVEARIKQNADTIYSIRLTQAEMTELRQAAKRRGIKLSELIREGAMDAAARAKEMPSPRDEALREARDLVGAAAKALDKLARP